MALPLLMASPYFWVFIGVAMLLLVYAAEYILVKPLTTILTRIPVIGGAVANAVSTGVGYIISWATSWAKTGLDAVAELVSVPVRAVSDWVSWTTSTVELTAANLGKVWDQLYGAIGNLVQNVATIAASASYALTKALQGVYGAQVAQRSVQHLQDSTIPQAAAAATASAAAYTASRIAAEANARASSVAAVRAEAQALAQTQRQQQLQGDQALAVKLALAAAALEGAIATGLANERTYSDAQRRALEMEMTDGIAQAKADAQAFTVARVATVAAELTAMRVGCVDPFCSFFGSKGSLLDALLTGAELALLASMVAGAIRDPEGSARDMAGTVDGLHGMAAGLLSPFGIAA